MALTKVYVVIRVDKNNDKVVWKVYDSEDKAKDFCLSMTNDEHKFKYEDWLVR